MCTYTRNLLSLWIGAETLQNEVFPIKGKVTGSSGLQVYLYDAYGWAQLHDMSAKNII